jgi:hypothetical protein
MMINTNISPIKQSAQASKSARSSRKWLIFGAIFFPLCGAYLIWLHAPLLIRDFGIAGSLAGAKRFHLIDANCRARLVFYSCAVKAGEFSGNSTHEVKFDYMFFDLPLAKHSVSLLEQQSTPYLITTDLGQETLWNRALTLSFIGLLCFFLPIILFRRSWPRPS